MLTRSFFIVSINTTYLPSFTVTDHRLGLIISNALITSFSFLNVRYLKHLRSYLLIFITSHQRFSTKSLETLTARKLPPHPFKERLKTNKKIKKQTNDNDNNNYFTVFSYIL